MNFFRYIFTAFNVINSLDKTNLLPMWWNIGPKTKYPLHMNRVLFNNQQYNLYLTTNNTFTITSDVCVHRGASLSKGKLENNCVICPYHGWKYQDGQIVDIPGMTSTLDFKKLSIGLSKFPIVIKNDDMYVGFAFDKNTQNCSNIIDFIYDPPEENMDFDLVRNTIRIKRPYRMVLENILDMNHVSYVHSFGNKLNPNPYNISFEKLGEYSGRTTYRYNSGQTSISKVIGLVKEVIVENEYHLPATAVTRVKADKITKTIVVHIIPTTDNECILYYKLYRNYLKSSPFVDWIHELLMKNTIKEDISILENCYKEYYDGLISTKYDVTQVQYRNSVNKILKMKNDINRIIP